jgi:hypothetical protein
MDQSEHPISEPPSCLAGISGSFPVRAFGYGTARYWAFLQAVLDGLRVYEAIAQEGDEYAAKTLPAA